jgi:RNA 3'-terminal phosphate cyclase (ATP)
MTVEIDGSHGEGGGQILRTSLALSIITGKPLVMTNIRAGRAKPGLRRQHLTCVHAAGALCGAELSGDTVGSKHLTFTPGTPTSSAELAFDIGTAGSTTLVLQTIIVPAIVAKRQLRITVDGGTHNPMAPPFDFLSRVFVPHLRAMGAQLELELERYGFVSGPASEPRRDRRQRSPRERTDDRDFYDREVDQKHRGRLVMTVGPGALAPIEIVDGGELTSRHAVSIIAGLPTHVADRELGVVRERMGFAHGECETREMPGGPANLVMIEVERASGRELVTVHGEKGLPAETVATRACNELAEYLSRDVPVGAHLADQLLLPMAVASARGAGRSRFRCAPLTLHATTNIDTIRRFLDVSISVDLDGDVANVSIS